MVTYIIQKYSHGKYTVVQRYKNVSLGLVKDAFKNYIAEIEDLNRVFALGIVSARIIDGTTGLVVESFSVSGLKGKRQQKMRYNVQKQEENHIVSKDGRHYYGAQAVSYNRGQHNRDYARYGIRRGW